MFATIAVLNIQNLGIWWHLYLSAVGHGMTCSSEFFVRHVHMSIRRLMAVLLVIAGAVAATRLEDGRGWQGIKDLVMFMACVILGMAVLNLLSYWGREFIGDRERENSPDLALGFRRILGAMAGFLCPHGGHCLRCYMPWELVKPHLTEVKGAAGSFFAVCNSCYQQITPAEVFQYYLMRMGGMYAHGYRPTVIDVEVLRQAVYQEAHSIAPDPEWEQGVA